MSMFRLKKDTCTNEPGVRSYIHRPFHTGSQRNLEISGRDAILKELDQRMLHKLCCSHTILHTSCYLGSPAPN